MRGSEICAAIMNRVREYIHSEEFRQKYRVGNRFTRIRKLTMGMVMTFLLFVRKRSLPNEISEFLSLYREQISEIIGKTVSGFTKQAISKARKGISLDAFYWLLDTSVSIWMQLSAQRDTWNGLHVFAIDGTDIQLPMREQCSSIFGTQKVRGDGAFPMAKGSMLYSVTNRLVVDALLDRCKYSEREMAMQHMDRFRKLKLAEKSVILMDRGYFSKELCEMMHNSNVYYVFRLRKNLNLLHDFRVSKKRSVILDLNKDTDSQAQLPVRVLRFKLSTGEYEYLLTNLVDPSFTISMLKELYSLRWGIEGKYRQMKSRFQLENFSGYSEEAIDQDFLISVFYANLVEILRSEADDRVRQQLNADNCRCKREYAPNSGLLVGSLKRYLPSVLLGLCDAAHAAKEIICCASQRSNWSQLMPGRHYSRQVKHPAIKFCYNRKVCF